MSAKTLPFQPRALRADRAAEYVGMGKTKFLELVDSGNLPKSIDLHGIRVWDRFDLDEALDSLKEAPERRNSFDVILGSKK